MPRCLTATAALLAGAVVTAWPLRAQAPRLGTITFPTSGPPEAQAAFLRGVLYLHSFEYGDAGEAFRDAQRLAPGFAMAYWGEALTYSHPVWGEQNRDAARAVLARLAPAPDGRRAKAPTAREQGYLEAVEILYGEGSKAERDTAYAAAMAALAARYPDDAEAKVFHAVALLGLNQGVRDIPTYMRAAAVVEEVFRDNPQHPGAAHFLIHSYDDPIHAPLGLRAARAYARTAPDAPHAQHMTTHIFLALGMWDDVVSQNEIASGHGHGATAPGHYTAWLEYGYLQQGRLAEAKRHLEQARAGLGSAPTARAYLMAMRAHFLINSERWDDPVREWTVDAAGVGPGPQSIDAFALGLAAARRGARAEAERWLAQLTERARAPAGQARYSANAQVPGILERELRALLKLQAGAPDEALALLREAAALEDALPLEFGPPDVVKPSHELLGEVLLGLGRPTEAQREFQAALRLAPKRALALLGLARAAAAAGDRKTTGRTYATLREVWHRADAGIPGLAEAAQFAETGGGR